MSEDGKSFTYLRQDLDMRLVSVRGYPAQPNFATPPGHCLPLHLLQAVHSLLPHLLCLCVPQQKQKHQHQVFQLRQLSCMQACMMHKNHFCWEVLLGQYI